MKIKKNKGFTLIELMIVVAIIAIIAAIAIPNLLRSRIQSNEAATIGNLRTINGAQTAYNSAFNAYTADWAELTTVHTPPYLDGGWDGVKSGYNLALGGGGNIYTVNAEPAEVGVSGERSFFTDTSGVIRVGADATAPPIGEVAAP